MSGHNKWSTIKHKKAAVDAKRGKLFTKIIRELTVSARAAGTDIEGNPRLRQAMAAARDANMPKDTMMNAIKRGTGEMEGVVFEECLYEGYGPGGTALLLDVVTDNKNRSVSEIRSCFTKGGGNLGESGCVGWMFERKGRIVVAGPCQEESLMEAALETGADDVVNEGETFSVLTGADPVQLETVRKFLEEKKFSVTAAEIARVPKTTVPLDEKNAESLLNLISKLEEMDDVQAVSSNYQIDDSVMEKIAARL